MSTVESEKINAPENIRSYIFYLKYKEYNLNIQEKVYFKNDNIFRF